MQLNVGEHSIEVEALIAAARRAGEAILEVYSQDFCVQFKADDSPLTLADQRSHEIIAEELERLGPAIPIVSEEAPLAPFQVRQSWPYFWLVDPLDGTKEFVARTGEFTVNLALVHRNEPVFGLVYAPALNCLYYAAKNQGSFRIDLTGTTRIDKDELKEEIDELIIISSRSHPSPSLSEFIERQRHRHNRVRIVSAGSALKFCLVAEGRAHVYPRLGPTREWDTAAAQVVATEAGKQVLEYESGQALSYNKPDLINPWLICR